MRELITVTIERQTLKNALLAQQEMIALSAAGVDNWEGYEMADWSAVNGGEIDKRIDELTERAGTTPPNEEDRCERCERIVHDPHEGTCGHATEFVCRDCCSTIFENREGSSHEYCEGNKRVRIVLQGL